MNRIATFTLLVAASFIPVCSALAQDHQVQAKIPFTFAVGDKWMPAGTYNIGSNTESATILTITDQTTKERAMAVGLPDHKDAGKTGKLVFHRVGNEYFLREILSADSNMHVALPSSKLEKRAATTQQVASVSGGDDVIIALN
jgi:hypothetical protein